VKRLVLYRHDVDAGMKSFKDFRCEMGGELLVRTEIRNGVEISPMPHEGLIRTKEVHLILGTKLDEPSQEKQIKDNLRTKLSACSPDTFNYRIFIEYNKA
jgi:hypothetical protein